jgi:hypothetical protein
MIRDTSCFKRVTHRKGGLALDLVSLFSENVHLRDSNDCGVYRI